MFRFLPTYDGAQIVHVDDGVAGARGEEAVQLRRGAVVMMPAERVDDLVVLLDAAEQLQAGGLVHVDTAGNTWSTHNKKTKQGWDKKRSSAASDTLYIQHWTKCNAERNSLISTFPLKSHSTFRPADGD